MALRNMMQGRPNFQPNPMALERATMRQRRGSLAGALRAIPEAGALGPAVRGGMVERYGDGVRHGLGREGARRMRQARGIGQFRDRVGTVLNAGDPSDASRLANMEHERALNAGDVAPPVPGRAGDPNIRPGAPTLGPRAGDVLGPPRAGDVTRAFGSDPRALDMPRRSGDRFAALGMRGRYDRDDYRADFGRNYRLRHPWRSLNTARYL